MDINSKMLMAELQSVIDAIRARQAHRNSIYRRYGPPVILRELSIPTVAVYTENGVKTFYKIESKLETVGDTKHLVITSVKQLDPNADRSHLPKKVVNALAAYEAGLYDGNWTQVIMTDSRITESSGDNEQDDLALLTERMVVIKGEPTSSYEQQGYTWSVPLFQSSLQVPEAYLNIFENWIKPVVEACDSTVKWKYSFSKYLNANSGGIRVRVIHRNKLISVLCAPYGDEGHIRVGFMIGNIERRSIGWTLVLPSIDAKPDEIDKQIFTDLTEMMKSSRPADSLSVHLPCLRRLCGRGYDPVVPFIYCGACRDTFMYVLGSGIGLSGLSVRVWVSRHTNGDGAFEYDIYAKSYLNSDALNNAKIAQEHPERVIETTYHTLRQYHYHADASCKESRVVETSWNLYEGLYEELHGQLILHRQGRCSDLLNVESETSEQVPLYALPFDASDDDDDDK